MNSSKLSALVFPGLFLLCSCGSYLSETKSPLAGDPLTVIRQDYEYSFELGAEAGRTYSIKNMPAWASFDTSSGKLSGIPNDTGDYADITISTSDGKQLAPFTVTVTGDPIKGQAWHLRNLGQKAFSAHAGTAGHDLNLSRSLREGILGEGIRVAISDSGTEILHEDLKANVLTGESRDYRSGATSPYLGDPTPSSSSHDGDHGTSVAGLIAAEGWNGLGSRGIAPKAKFATFNFLNDDVTTTAALEVNQLSGNFDVFNQSWGLDGTADGTLPTYYTDELLYGVTAQPASGARAGLGSLYVKAAGNSFQPATNATWLTADANVDYYNASPYLVVVGALNAKGVHASYSSIGSVLWIAGFGGEDGASNPAMVSTDRSGCTKGYSVSGETLNDFENGSSLNAHCNYTSGFNGTSSATPTISGAVALILSANPNLGWRDVKHILAATATKVDAGFSPISNRAADPTGYVWDPGWVTNAAGYSFHNYYGFGKVNVDAAVDLAKTYSSSWGHGDFSKASVSRTGLSLSIPDDSATGVTSTATTASTLTIEAVEIELSVTHTYTGDLAVELTSPGGTKSVLLHMNNALEDNANLAGVKFISNAFYGEIATGTWTLKVLDGAHGDTGTVTSWKLNVYGH